MNWNEIGTQLIIGIVGVIISALGVYITYLINKWVKDKDLKEIVLSLNQVVQQAVLTIYQTYVEELKCKNEFTLEAQKLALDRCLSLIKTNIPIKVKTWLEANYEDIDRYLKSLIEAQIGLLKNGGKK